MAKGTKTSKPTKTQKARPSPANAGKPPKAKPGWEFAVFTKKSAAFHAAAKTLADSLNQTYGETVTISAYEKLVSAYPTFSDEQKTSILIDKDHVAQLQIYLSSKEERDSERQAFLGDVKVKDISSSITTILTDLNES